MKRQTLGLVFTYKNSVANMAGNGSLDREVSYYQQLGSNVDVYWFSYGAKDVQFQSQLPQSITIIPKPNHLPNFIYSLLLPLIHRKHIAKCTLLKTNQILGAWTAQIASALFRKPLLLRSGYTNSLSYIGSPSINQRIRNSIEAIAYRYFDHAIVTTELQKKHLIKRYHLDPNKISVLPNAIDTELFAPSSKPRPKSKHIRLLYVGRLSPEKNVDQLIRITKKLDAHTTIIGAGPLEKALRQQANDSGAKIKFIPKIPNNKLPMYYNNTDFYMQLSSYEGNPKTILEAMSCGCVVVATNVRGISNIISHQHNGILIQRYDVSDIKRMYADDKMYQSIKKHARSTIQNTYQMKSIASTEVRLIQQLAQGITA